MFKKILIANRGEIAIRIARACHELGISVIGVYSDVDDKSLHLQYCDNIVHIGESAPLASYLNIPKLIDVAVKHNAEAIHPGYGFLAENALFAKACEESGIIFIGPSSAALTLVGDKVASRLTAKKIKAPLIPGMEIPGKELGAFKVKAEEVGYPVMIKASMGGGGKGMRIVHDEKALLESVEASRREAKSAFGDETVYLEKYIDRPRHVEFQVLRDMYGNVVHLYERECSIQRRHQKIIEETPSPALTPDLREKMGETAKRLIEASDYVNAGTVEFLLDADRNYYFLEVNARVQVEHPITELVTGIDIVKQQIRIAGGEKMTLRQEQISQRGHAIEARIYAEDADNNFLPSPGEILLLHEPLGPGIRVDSGIYAGWNVPPHYDPILSKLIAWAENRSEAIRRADIALSRYIILGIKTNIAFLKRIMTSDKFIKGDVHTHFIDSNVGELMPRRDTLPYALIAAVLYRGGGTKRFVGPTEPVHEKVSPWHELGKWEICGQD